MGEKRTRTSEPRGNLTQSNPIGQKALRIREVENHTTSVDLSGHGLNISLSEKPQLITQLKIISSIVFLYEPYSFSL